VPVLAGMFVGCSGDPPDSGGGSDSDPWIDDVATLEQGGQISCIDPALRDTSRFEKRTVPNPSNSDIWLWAGGELAGDLDGDGSLDLIAPNEIAKANLMAGTPAATFIQKPETLEPFDLSLGIGGTMVDYDGDGDLDVYILLYDAANILLRNDGGFNFTDVTAEAGVTGCEVDGSVCYKSMSSSWADYDRDGDLDLIVGNYGYVLHDGTEVSEFEPGEPSFLYENDGDGTFTDVTEEVLPRSTMSHVHDGYTYVAGFHDLNRDGWPELYFVNDFGTYQISVLLWNDQGTLVLDNGLHGLDQNQTGMGLALGDINGDGYPDLLIPEWNKNTYLESTIIGADQLLWVRKDQELGLVPNNAVNQKVGWGAEWGDMDNDGDLDAIIAYGHVKSQNAIWDNPFQQPDGLYLQQPGGTFVDESNLWGSADDGVGRGFVVADFNNDGWLDIAKRDLAGPNILQVSHCGSENWMRVRLRSPGTLNTQAIGGVVRMVVGDLEMTRTITAGGTGYASSGPPEVHFGLGPHETIDALTVTWPDGQTSAFRDVPSRQILSIIQK
jgi:hypothetical protein